MSTLSIINRNRILTILTLLSIAVVFFLPAISQDIHYHEFADNRMIMGIPNFLNVISNVPFLIVGIFGLRTFFKNISSRVSTAAALFFFIGIILTGLGSAWYHLDPSNASLLFDRLPMTVTFTSLLAFIVSEHVNKKLGNQILLPLLILGTLSVVYWYVTEQAGQGDLRPYALVQFFPMLMIPVIMLMYPVKGTASALLIPIVGFYAIAKFFELCDHDLYAFGQIISGHTIKHIVAALATAPALFFWKFYHQTDMNTNTQKHEEQFKLFNPALNSKVGSS